MSSPDAAPMSGPAANPRTCLQGLAPSSAHSKPSPFPLGATRLQPSCCREDPTAQAAVGAICPTAPGASLSAVLSVLSLSHPATRRCQARPSAKGGAPFHSLFISSSDGLFMTP